MMATTPRPVIDSVVRSVCGREVERLVRLIGGGLHETYRVEVRNDVPVVVRIARQPVPWFTDEEHVMAQARGVGVPTPTVLGVETSPVSSVGLTMTPNRPFAAWMSC